MVITSVSELRKNMAWYLEKVKISKKPLVFWNRHKREYLLLAYPENSNDENLFEIYENLEDKIIMSDYYKGLESLMSDWNDKEHENLFVNT